MRIVDQLDELFAEMEQEIVSSYREKLKALFPPEDDDTESDESQIQEEQAHLFKLEEIEMKDEEQDEVPYSQLVARAEDVI